MNIDTIEELAKQEMADRQDQQFREPGWILYHGKRTGKIACHLAELTGCTADRDILYVAGLFHDIGKGQQEHNQVGAEIARELLSDLVAEDPLNEICQAIGNHNQRKKSPDFPETDLLIQDADSIDHVGMIDVWMAFYWSGRRNETIHDQITWCEGENYQDYLQYIRTHVNFAPSKKILEERIQLAEGFFSDFQRIYFEGI